ncbi:hypothetical protein HMPREF1141_0402 [Clostridium sp. MSTE9]|nr:hypothetical protein HMPREF1141_0402 [Clostridium sp. MSTE9]
MIFIDLKSHLVFLLRILKALAGSASAFRKPAAFVPLWSEILICTQGGVSTLYARF